MKKLVLTIAIGDYHRRMGEVTHPTLRAYAEKIGADFTVINRQKISRTTPHWEKFQIFDYLNNYERLLFLDTDIIVRGDCPDLFTLVPPESIGAFNESPYADRDGQRVMAQVAAAYGCELEHWDSRYFNTGVLVLSRAHQSLFRKPDEEVDNFYEQSYLNLTFALTRTPMSELDFRYNRTPLLDKFTAEPRLDSFIIHYAGCVAPTPETMFDFIRQDLTSWREHLT